MNRFERVDELYRQRGFSAQLGFGSKWAVVVIDFINAFTDSTYRLGGNYDQPVQNVARLLKAVEPAGVPVIYTTTAYQPDYLDAGYFIQKVPAMQELLLGSEAVEIDPRLSRKDTDILLVKKYASAFFGTSLVSILAQLRVDTLLITGCTTSGCVRATTVDALQYGFRPIVLTDCIGDRDPVVHENNLFDLQAKYADLATSNEVIERLENITP